MSKLLFEEVPQKMGDYIKRYKSLAIMLLIFASIFFLIGLICLLIEAIVSIIPFVFAILMSILLLKTVLQNKQYLYIYDDKICYKKTFQKSAKEILITPSEYKIELKEAMPKSGYTIKFIFRKLNNEIIFTYKAVSIIPSMYQAQKYQWEVDLFAIGCDITNDHEIIKNK